MVGRTTNERQGQPHTGDRLIQAQRGGQERPAQVHRLEQAGRHGGRDDPEVIGGDEIGASFYHHAAPFVWIVRIGERA